MKKILATTLFAVILFSCSMNVNAAGLKDVFSAEYYADSYADLYAAFEYDEAKLLKHVKEYGLKEKRDVSPILDVVYYRETYPDLNAAFGDNWDLYVNHYFEYGIKEGRDNGTNFDIIRYVNSYADLRQAFDEDYEALARHYIEYGMKENRTMALKPQVPTTVQSSTTETPIPSNVVQSHDAQGRVIKEVIYTDDSLTEISEIIEYEYRDNGDRTEMHYDSEGRVTEALLVNAEGKPEQYMLVTGWDGEGNPITGTTYVYTDGVLTDERVAVNGKLVEQKMYYLNGQLSYHETVDSITDYRIIIEYDMAGTMRFYQEYDADNNLIVDREYDENGNEIITEEPPTEEPPTEEP